MQVLATAGHVDHGKSTLIHQLTGADPDRWAEEHRRGLTLDLGFAWTELPGGETVAFVDVPGHERFVANMLAGVGPVSAVLFVLAADQGWQAQSTEHLAALHALGVRHGIVVITRCDLADPRPTAQRAQEQLRGTPLAEAPVCQVSGSTGAGIDQLRVELDALTHRIPEVEQSSAVRVWIDRAFAIRGAGTVVTGTLPAGSLRVGQQLLLHPHERSVTVRGMQTLGQERSAVHGVARVALNVRGAEHREIRRGHALLTAADWWITDVVDVRTTGVDAQRLPRQLVAHVGTTALTVRVRPLGTDTARVQLRSALPLHVGDRLVLREPGEHRVRGSGLVLDVAPPPLRRRGDARRRADRLRERNGTPDVAVELAERGLVRVADLCAMGVSAYAWNPRTPWLLDNQKRSALAQQLVWVVEQHRRAHPLEDGVPGEVALRELGLPDRELLRDVATSAGITFRHGTLQPGSELPNRVVDAAKRVRALLRDRPFQAPTAAELADIGISDAELAAADRAEHLLRLAPGVVLGPDSAERAHTALSGLEQPFTPSQARRALHTSRRVVVPLLEHLARAGHTRRFADGTHRVRDATTPSPNGRSTTSDPGS